MPIVSLKKTKTVQLEAYMVEFKLSSIVMVLMIFFIAKISVETVNSDKTSEKINDRSAASIDQSYREHMDKH